jgi:hypothetical protein
MRRMTVSFVRPGTVKYIHYLEVQINLYFYQILVKFGVSNVVELIKFCEKGKPYFSYGKMELCLCVYS